MRFITISVLLISAVVEASAQSASLAQQVRLKLSAGDFDSAEAMVDEFQKAKGNTDEAIEGLSWLARGALYMKDYDVAKKYATQTRALTLEALKKTTLEKSHRLEGALGASIEVQSQAEAAQGHRQQAVKFLTEELKRWQGSGLEPRLYKNLNQLSAEGVKAPPIEGFQTDGRPAMVFLWAHWCGDCKGMSPVIARVLPKYADRGVRLVAPTQLYGYIGSEENVPVDRERAYIEKSWAESYKEIAAAPHPVSTETMRRYGVSTTPTIVFIDRAGIVRKYHSGRLTEAALDRELAALVGEPSAHATRSGTK
jgi:thiol-disulfide isomerase/thioredoxin